MNESRERAKHVIHRLVMAIKSSVVSISTNLLDRFPEKDFYVDRAITLLLTEIIV